MAKRKHISKRASKRMFTQIGMRTPSINLAPPPMRGGYRL